jgi:Trk-type K+ transport system membrane component
MPTTTLGVIIDGTKLSQIFGVINATLGDFKILFYLLMGWVIGFWIIQFILSLLDKRKSLPGDLMTRDERIKRSYDVEAEEAGYGYEDDEEDDDEDDEE